MFLCEFVVIRKILKSGSVWSSVGKCMNELVAFIAIASKANNEILKAPLWCKKHKDI